METYKDFTALLEVTNEIDSKFLHFESTKDVEKWVSIQGWNGAKKLNVCLADGKVAGGASTALAKDWALSGSNDRSARLAQLAIFVSLAALVVSSLPYFPGN